MQPRIKPPALSPGNKVAIIAPASPVENPAFTAGLGHLRKLGYEPFYNSSIFDCDLFFAGSAERRARELEEMFEREDVRAIVCARGGYGSNHLLHLLDARRIAAHPKIFIGYSDITTLHTWLLDRVNLVTFHGPMLAKDFAVESGIDLPSWNAALAGSTDWKPDVTGALPLVSGEAEGILYGGCLSLLVASLGTPFEIQTRETILFLEDVAAKPFQIDRMLMQLRLSGKFEGVRGIIFGEMRDCVQPGVESYSLPAGLQRALADLHVPVAFGLRSGHVSGSNLTLPLGVRTRLIVDAAVDLTILEAATAQPLSAKERVR